MGTICSLNLHAGEPERYVDPDGTMTTPPSGIHIVPDSQIKQRKQELTKEGYIYSNDPNPKTLMNIKDLATKEIKENIDNKDPVDTHLKKNYTEIDLAFPFKGIPLVDKNKIIGYAAALSYEKGKGWLGIAGFFEDDSFGICKLSLYNIHLSHGGANFGESTVDYAVNKKPTTASVTGNPHIGFLYDVAWYDNTYIHELQCAKMDLDKQQIRKMIEFANKIDPHI